METTVGFSPFARSIDSQITQSEAQYLILLLKAKLREIGGRKATGPWSSDSRVAGTTDNPSCYKRAWLGFFFALVRTPFDYIRNGNVRDAQLL